MKRLKCYCVARLPLSNKPLRSPGKQSDICPCKSVESHVTSSSLCVVHSRVQGHFRVTVGVSTASTPLATITASAHFGKECGRDEGGNLFHSTHGAGKPLITIGTRILLRSTQWRFRETGTSIVLTYHESLTHGFLTLSQQILILAHIRETTL